MQTTLQQYESEVNLQQYDEKAKVRRKNRIMIQIIGVHWPSTEEVVSWLQLAWLLLEQTYFTDIPRDCLSRMNLDIFKNILSSISQRNASNLIWGNFTVHQSNEHKHSANRWKWVANLLQLLQAWYTQPNIKCDLFSCYPFQDFCSLKCVRF